MEVVISFDLQHVKKKYQEVVDMIRKIDKNVKVSVIITNMKGKCIDDNEDDIDVDEELKSFDARSPLPIKRGFYDLIHLTDIGVLDVQDVLDSGENFLKSEKFVIKCKLCEMKFTNEDDFKSHNKSQKHYLKYAADFCQRRDKRKKQEIANNCWKNENLGEVIFNILHPIIHQISKLDMAGKIILQPGVDGLKAAKECFEEILFDILMASTDIFYDTNYDSGFDI